MDRNCVCSLFLFVWFRKILPRLEQYYSWSVIPSLALRERRPQTNPLSLGNLAPWRQFLSACHVLGQFRSDPRGDITYTNLTSSLSKPSFTRRFYPGSIIRSRNLIRLNFSKFTQPRAFVKTTKVASGGRSGEGLKHPEHVQSSVEIDGRFPEYSSLNCFRKRTGSVCGWMLVRAR